MAFPAGCRLPPEHGAGLRPGSRSPSFPGMEPAGVGSDPNRPGTEGRWGAGSAAGPLPPPAGRRRRWGPRPLRFPGRGAAGRGRGPGPARGSRPGGALPAVGLRRSPPPALPPAVAVSALPGDYRGISSSSA